MASTEIIEQLFQAVFANEVASIRRLVEQGADPNAVATEGHTPLYCAAVKGNAAAILTLLDLGADPDARFTYHSSVSGGVWENRTALMYAVSPDAAEALLKQGADPNSADREGETPLTLAAWRGHPEVVATLLAAGADPFRKRPQTRNHFPATAREIAEEKLSFWREAPATEAIAGRIAALEKVCTLLQAAEQGQSMGGRG